MNQYEEVEQYRKQIERVLLNESAYISALIAYGSVTKLPGSDNHKHSAIIFIEREARRCQRLN